MALTSPPLVVFLGLRRHPRPLPCADSDPCLLSESHLKLPWRSLRPPDLTYGHGQVQGLLSVPHRMAHAGPRFPKGISVSAYNDQPHTTMARPFAPYSLACDSEGLSALVKDTVVYLLTYKCQGQEGTRESRLAVSPLCGESMALLKQHSRIVL